MCDKNNDKEEIENEKDDKKEKLIKQHDMIIGKVKNNDNENDQFEYKSRKNKKN